MSIRNAAKAIIVHEGKVLLNRYRTPEADTYYALPGGGQNQYETMEEAVIRECLEETGYTVLPETLVAVHEVICTTPQFRIKHPDYAHKIFHVFRCSLASLEKNVPTEPDSNQAGCVWVDITDIPSIHLYPPHVHERFPELLTVDHPLYLGSVEVTF